jgi:hypothetical protein
MALTSFMPKVPSFAHQLEGVKRLIEHDGVYALLWDPGTGKTKTVIDYLSWLALAAGREVRVMVVCPKAVTDSWVEQGNAFVHDDVDLIAQVLSGSINDKAAALAKRDTEFATPSINMRVINVESLSSRRQVSKTSSKLHSDLLLDSVKKWNPHVLVVDE